ncbi:MAG TPA: hypothetical protein VLH19_04195 [Patescibacteria group bacterium]|nr:hypothetical protein [Patescibacteria group bacterium]
MKAATLLLTILTVVIALGALIFPQLQSYALQIIALIAIFTILLRHIGLEEKKHEGLQAKKEEQSLLFLTTKVKPMLEEAIEKKEVSTLKLTVQEINSFIHTHEED